MSPSTRDMVVAILDGPLAKWHATMDQLERTVAEEVVRQFELQTLDLKTLYKRVEGSRRKSAAVNSGAAQRDRKDEGGGKSERTLAKALEFDEDEVF